MFFHPQFQDPPIGFGVLDAIGCFNKVINKLTFDHLLAFDNMIDVKIFDEMKKVLQHFI